MPQRYPFNAPAFVTRSLSIKRGENYENVLVEMQEDLFSQVQTAANESGKSVETFLKDLLSDYRLDGQRLVDHQSIEHLMESPPVESEAEGTS